MKQKKIYKEFKTQKSIFIDLIECSVRYIYFALRFVSEEHFVILGTVLCLIKVSITASNICMSPLLFTSCSSTLCCSRSNSLMKVLVSELVYFEEILCFERNLLADLFPQPRTERLAHLALSLCCPIHSITKTCCLCASS